MPLPPEIKTRRITRAQFLHMLSMQHQPTIDQAYTCPRCQTIQSMRTLIRAGWGNSEAKVEPFMGFVCVKCRWEVHGRDSVPPIIVVEEYPFFMPATPEEARSLLATTHHGAR